MARPSPRPFPIGIALIGFAVVLALAGCGKNWGDLEPVAVSDPQTHLPRLPLAQVLAASEGRLNTYHLLGGDRPDSQIRLTILPWNAEQSGESTGRTWRSYDGSGSYAEVLLIPGTGYAIKEIQSPRNEAAIIFDEPLIVAPPTLALGEPHTHQAGFEGWARGWSRRRGTISITTRYVGLQDVTVPLGRFEDCALVESRVRVRLPIGFTVTVNNRQWLHPSYGDVARDIDGRLSWAMIGVTTYRRRLELIATEPLDEAGRLEVVGEGIDNPASN